MTFFAKIEKSFPKLILKQKGLWIVKATLSKKNHGGINNISIVTKTAGH